MSKHSRFELEFASAKLGGSAPAILLYHCICDIESGGWRRRTLKKAQPGAAVPLHSKKAQAGAAVPHTPSTSWARWLTPDVDEKS